MAGNKTNSNSITTILVNRLNYKKSGFRAKMLTEWELPYSTLFRDGTHSSLNFPEMEGKQVDIVGWDTDKNKENILIEIKANLDEDIQDSQKENGQYQKTANNNKIPLKYIVPDRYYHQNELPQESELIKVIRWSEIYNFAKEYDDTGFTEIIENFVQTDFNGLDLVLNKGEVAMFLSPEMIGNVISLESKIDILMYNFAKEKGYTKDKKELWGSWYKINYGEKSKKIWIGLFRFAKASKYSLFMFIYNSPEIKIIKSENYKENEDYFFDINRTNSDGLYIPITEEENKGNDTIPQFLFSENVEDQQKEFNRLMEYNIKKFFDIVE